MERVNVRWTFAGNRQVRYYNQIECVIIMYRLLCVIRGIFKRYISPSCMERELRMLL